MKILHVLDAEYIGGHRVRVSFNDGASGIVDLSEELDGRIFEPLLDTSYFKSFEIKGHTLTWPNGADFAPEFLRSRLQIEHVASV